MKNQHNIVLARQQSRINEIKNERAIRDTQLVDLDAKIKLSHVQLSETEVKLAETQSQLKQFEEKLYTSLQEKEVNEKVLNEN